MGLLASAGTGVVLAGCSSPNPKLYAIAPVPGQALPGGPRIIAVHTIGLARYLERPQIVISSEDYRLNVAANDWWGEPLGAMLSRILVSSLAQRLPGSSVFSETGAITVEPDAAVEVNIQRMDADRAGNVILDAQLAVSFVDRSGSPTRRHGTDTRAIHLSVPPPAPGLTGQVAATSTAIGQMADALAAMLRAGGSGS